MGASPSSGAITINLPNTHDYCSWHVMEFDGVDTGGTNGSAAVVQSATNSGSGTAITATLAAFGDAGNGTFSFSGGYNTSSVSTTTPGTGFSEIYDTGQAYYYNVTQHSQWRADNDTTVTGTWSVSQSGWAAIAIEIKAAAVGVVNPKGPLGMPFHGPFGGPI